MVFIGKGFLLSVGGVGKIMNAKEWRNGINAIIIGLD